MAEAAALLNESRPVWTALAIVFGVAVVGRLLAARFDK
jgi:hypothetical protein